MLKNYRKFKNETIEFPDGVFGIIGKNGAGKSSIIEAVGWALYGSYAAKTGQELIRWEHAPPDSDCSVELEFILGNNSYRVLRELRGRNQSPQAKLYVDSGTMPEVSGAQPVTDFVSNRIGMDYRAFFTSVCAKQKELNALSILKPAERKKTILRLLRINKIDVALEEVRKDKKSSDDMIKAIEATLQDIGVLESTLQDFRRKKDGINTVIKDLRNILQESKQSLAQAKIIRSQWEKKNRKYQKLSNQLKVQETSESINTKNLEAKKKELEGLVSDKEELTNIKPKLKPYNSIKSKKEKLDELREKYLECLRYKNDLTNSDNTVAQLNKEHRKIKLKLNTLKNLDTRLKAEEKRKTKLEKSRRNLGNLIQSKKTSIKESKQQLKELTSEFKKIEKLGPGSKCPTCKRILGRYYPDIVKHFNAEIAKINQRIKSYSSEVSTLSLKLTGADKQFTKITGNISQFNKMLRQKARDEQKSKNLVEQINNEKKKRKIVASKLKALGLIRYNEPEHERLKTQFRELTKDHERALTLHNNVARIPAVRNQITAITKTLNSINTKKKILNENVSSLGFSNDEYNNAKRNYEKASTTHHNNEKKLINSKSELRLVQKDIIRTQKDIVNEKKKRKKIEREKGKIELLLALDKLLGDFRIELISRIRPMLSLRASELFRKLTDGKYLSIQLDEDYGISIEDNGKMFPLERFSGGEEDLANLCLRIAISQVIEERAGAVSINFIALDEIFGSQDETRKANILKVLNDLSTQFRQIILITHVEDVKDTLPYAFNVVENPDESSRIIIEGTPKLSL